MADPIETKTSLDVEGVPPRGDLVREIKALVTEQSRPQIVGATDPVSGATALVILSRDSEGNEEVRPFLAGYFDDYLEAPRFRQGRAVLTSLDSFIEHTNRFKDESSVVFACDNRNSASLTTVLDYHPANEAREDGIYSAAPRHGRHRSAFSFPLSDEWKSWTESDASPMTMTQFAAFLEDRIVDVAAPGEINLSEQADRFVATLGGKSRMATPTNLIELSRGLHIYENSAVAEARNLSSGEGEISFVAEHLDKAGKPLIVPTTFTIAIPVFRNGPLTGLVARLRYRKTGAGIVFFYELWGVDRTFDAEFSRAVDEVAQKTGLPVLLGAPEA